MCFAALNYVLQMENRYRVRLELHHVHRPHTSIHSIQILILIQICVEQEAKTMHNAQNISKSSPSIHFLGTDLLNYLSFATLGPTDSHFWATVLSVSNVLAILFQVSD